MKRVLLFTVLSAVVPVCAPLATNTEPADSQNQALVLALPPAPVATQELVPPPSPVLTQGPVPTPAPPAAPAPTQAPLPASTPAPIQAPGSVVTVALPASIIGSATTTPVTTTGIATGGATLATGSATTATLVGAAASAATGTATATNLATTGTATSTIGSTAGAILGAPVTTGSATLTVSAASLPGQVTAAAREAANTACVAAEVALRRVLDEIRANLKSVGAKRVTSSDYAAQKNTSGITDLLLDAHGWVSMPSTSSPMVAFAARAQHDVIFAFKHTAGWIEIVYGGWNNTRSVVRAYNAKGVQTYEFPFEGVKIQNSLDFGSYVASVISDSNGATIRLEVVSPAGAKIPVFTHRHSAFRQMYSAYSFRAWGDPVYIMNANVVQQAISTTVGASVANVANAVNASSTVQGGLSGYAQQISAGAWRAGAFSRTYRPYYGNGATRAQAEQAALAAARAAA